MKKNKRNVDVAYKKLVKDILKNGVLKGDRTGTGTLSTFGQQIKIDLSQGFPLLTTKKVYWKGIVVETVAFLKGITDLKFFLDYNVDIWTRDAWKFYLKNKKYRDNYFYNEPDMDLEEFREYASEHGFDMGEIYGYNWVNFNGDGIDQLQSINYQIKNEPDSRRMKVYSANPSKTHNQTLPPCHDAFQFYVYDNKLSCIFQMRSSDTFLGLPFNIASYALITSIFAEMNNLKVGELIGQLGDSHIYSNHLDIIKEQIKRESLPLPTLKLSERVKGFESISEIELEDIKLLHYQSHGILKAPQAF